MPVEKIKVISELYESTSRGGNRHKNPDDIPDPSYEKLLADFILLKGSFDYTK